MEFEVLKRSHLKRNMVIVLLVVAIISAIVLNFTRAKYKTEESIPLINGTINYKIPDFNTLAIYIEDSNNNYISTNEVPSDGYDFNQEKSYCTTNNKTDTSIQIEYLNGLISLSNINKRTKCYFYFNLQENATNLKDKIIANNGGKEKLETNIIKDFSVIAPRTIKTVDEGTKESSVFSTDATIITYLAYADSYDFNEETGLYSLNDPIISSYQEAYNKIKGKYISTPYYTSETSTNIPTNNLEQVYEVTDTNSKLIYMKESVKTQISDMNDKGLYKTSDSYGTSYYFRGAVDNNWLYFAGFYWRIIRINGDGSIRLIYTGKKGEVIPANAPVSYRNINTVLNNSNNYPYTMYTNQAEYVGYMYELGLSHGVKYDSFIKSIVDAWYKNNLKNYTSYLADNGFCNDRSSVVLGSVTTPAEAIGTNQVDFNPLIRNYINKNPSLKCSNKEDNFTVQDIQNGNGALTYPIGLITIDEVAYAGAVYEKVNHNNYLTNAVNYWTMSPFNSGNGKYKMSNMNVAWNGMIASDQSNNANGGIRPVISLKSTVKAIGNGTSSNPYVVISTE